MQHHRELEEFDEYYGPGISFDFDEMRGWKIFSEYGVGPLTVIEGESSNGKAIYAETEALEGMLGYTAEELMEELDRVYRLNLSEESAESYDYGDGWAIFRLEE